MIKIVKIFIVKTLAPLAFYAGASGERPPQEFDVVLNKKITSSKERSYKFKIDESDFYQVIIIQDFDSKQDITTDLLKDLISIENKRTKLDRFNFELKKYEESVNIYSTEIFLSSGIYFLSVSSNTKVKFDENTKVRILRKEEENEKTTRDTHS